MSYISFKRYHFNGACLGHVFGSQTETRFPSLSVAGCWQLNQYGVAAAQLVVLNLLRSSCWAGFEYAS